MEDGERIPIEIEQPADASGQTVLADGTVVFDVYSPPCPSETEQADDDAIVVCAQSERMAELEAEAASGERQQAIKLKLSEDADATLIGATESGPMGGNGQEATVRLRFGF